MKSRCRMKSFLRGVLATGRSSKMNLSDTAIKMFT